MVTRQCCSCYGAHPFDGPWAWLVCFSAAIANSLHFGFTQSFGVYLPVLADYFKENRERTAWVGSITVSLMFVVGPLGAMLSERFSHRAVGISSGMLCTISLITSSFATNLYILYFTYGILFGIGGGCLMNIAYGINAKYFKDSKRAITTGIIASGSSFGVIFMGPTLQALIEAFGWRNSMRVMAGVMSVICLLVATYHPNIQNLPIQQDPELPSRRCKYIDCSVWRNVTFVIGTITIMMAYIPLFVPYVHIVKFANDLQISSKKASQLFIYIGVLSTSFRVATGPVLDKKWMTPLQGVQLSSLILGVAIIALASATTYVHFVVFAIVFGIANGFFVTTHNVFFQTVVGPDKSSMGVGMGYLACSPCLLGGAPLAGFIADEFGSYIPSFYATGGLLVFAALFPFSLLLVKKCRDLPLIEHSPVTIVIEEDTKDSCNEQTYSYMTAV